MCDHILSTAHNSSNGWDTAFAVGGFRKTNNRAQDGRYRPEAQAIKSEAIATIGEDWEHAPPDRVSFRAAQDCYW